MPKKPSTQLTRSICRLALAALALGAGACGAEDPTTPPPQDPTATIQIDTYGQGTPSVVPELMSESDLASLPALAAAGPQSVAASDSATASASCWVTLNWCSDPKTKKPICTATAGCPRPAPICDSLIPQYCGNVPRNGVVCGRASATSTWTCTTF
jgi:hypothetical protein